MTAAVVSAAFPALGTTAAVFVTQPDSLERARRVLSDELVLIDDACSRFRDDSELARVNDGHGEPREAGPLLLDAVDAALRAAALTDGDVDPTVGRAMRANGYDRDFDSLQRSGSPAVALPAAGWRSVTVDRSSSTVRVPPGVELDLGSTAKALAADRAAGAVHRAVGAGVLVNLGGDIAIAGEPPPGGWRVRVTDDHRAAPDAPGQTIALASGGLATSSVSVRHWERSGRHYHHIVNPRTGAPATVVWRTVSTVAATCLDANVATTAAIVRGAPAVAWLASLSLPSRLVRNDGSVVRVAGWPEATA